MNRTVKIAALGAALSLCLAAFASCASEDPRIKEAYEKVAEGSGNTLSSENGEIYIVENTYVENDIPGHAVNGETETYITYTGADLSVFTLQTKTAHPETGEIVEYELVKDGDTVLEIIDGTGDFVEISDIDIPDIFDDFRISYEAGDIESAADAPKENGTRLYTFTMKSSYADKFDTDIDGVASDCTAVVYECYVTHEKALERVVATYTYTITAAGTAQQMVKSVDAKIA